MLPNADLLAVPLLIAFFLITGLRFVFEMPAVLNANWVFRLAIQTAEPSPSSMVRRLMLMLILPWEVLILTPITAQTYGWKVALMQSGTVVVLTVLAVDLLTANFHKIPFTFSTRPDVKQLLLRILGALIAVMLVVPMLAGIEHWMLVQPLRFIGGAIVVAIGWFSLQRYKRGLLAEEQALTFEERAASPFELLKLA